VWDADEVRDRVRAYAVAELADDDPVLIFDETGFCKKGAMSAGVARQYTGTTGQVENCQIGVFATYATSRGHCLIDRELYAHRSWFEDRQEGGDRCRKAHIPEQLCLVTKPRLALRMAERTLSAGVRVGWIVGDEVYGRSGALREWARERGIGAVLAVPRNHRVELRAGERKVRVDQVEVPPSVWGRYSAGSGSKGRRYFRWALVATTDPAVHLLIRRPSKAPKTSPNGKNGKNGKKKDARGDWAFFWCYTPRPVPIKALVRVAGLRWPVEETFQTGKNETGLDQYQVRTWHGWYRHITLSMLASAFLAVTAARERVLPDDPGDAEPVDTGITPQKGGPPAVDNPYDRRPRSTVWASNTT
jgi:SRSO17 transposase